MANLQYLDEQLGIPEEEEEGLLGKALRSIDAPRQYLLEKTLGGISGEDVDRGSLDFGDVTEGLLGQQFMVDNPRTYAALSTAGDLLYDPLNFIPFAGIGKLGKSLMNMGRKISKGESPVNFGNIALGQEITRRDKAGQLHELGGWYSGDPTKKGFWGSPAGSKIKHMTLGMIPDALKNMAIRGVDSKSAYLFDEFGIDSNVVKELETLFKQKRALEKGEDYIVKNRDGKPLKVRDLIKNKFKVTKSGKTKATKVFDSQKEADEFIAGLKNPDDYSVTSSITKLDGSKLKETGGLKKRLDEGGLDAEMRLTDAHKFPEHMVQNELLSQLEYVGSTLQKYFPDSKRHNQFMENLKQDLFPETAFTDAARLSAGDTTALSKIYPEIEPQILSEHIAPFITKEWGLKGDVALNSKNFHEGMLNKLRGGKEFVHRDGKRYHSGTNLPGLLDSTYRPGKEAVKTLFSEGLLYGGLESAGKAFKKNTISKSSYDEMGRDLGINYVDAVADLTKNMDVISKERLLAEAARRNKEYDEIHSLVGKTGAKGTKTEAAEELKEAFSAAPVYFDIPGLQKAIKETADGTISVGTPALLDDRLLAHAALRMVIPRGGREGFLVGFDQMKLGSIKALDALVDRGSKYNFIAGDVEKIVLDPANKTGLRTLKGDAVGPLRRVQNPTVATGAPEAKKLSEQERIENVMEIVGGTDGMLAQKAPRGYAAKRTAGLLAPYMQGAHVYDKLDEENKLELYKQFYEDNLSKPISGLLGL
jgi:hypothetical protein